MFQIDEVAVLMKELNPPINLGWAVLVLNVPTRATFNGRPLSYKYGRPNYYSGRSRYDLR